MMSSHSEAIDEIPLRISALVAVGLLMFVGLSSAAILMLRRTSTLPSPSPSPLQLALQSGVLRLGVETRPHVIGPADYQTRRADRCHDQRADKSLAEVLGDPATARTVSAYSDVSAWRSLGAAHFARRKPDVQFQLLDVVAGAMVCRRRL